MTASAYSTSPAAPASAATVWAARIMMTLAVLFLAFDSVIKVMQTSIAVDATVKLGYPASAVAVIGAIEIVSLIAYVIPRTSVFGAILLTGHLGGAIASQLRAGNPLFSHVLFPIYVALLLWAPLYLRDARVRALIPLRS
jgi:hypothetical protein